MNIDQIVLNTLSTAIFLFMTVMLIVGGEL